MTGSASFPVADAAPVIKNRSPSKDSIFEGGQRSSLKSATSRGGGAVGEVGETHKETTEQF